MAEAFTKDQPWVHRLLASVALSHPADHDCEVCKAAAGDEDAFAEIMAFKGVARLFAASQERRK